MTHDWILDCSYCDRTAVPAGLDDVCPDCGQPWLVRYDRRWPISLRSTIAARPWSMWRYREMMPLASGESPVSLGEGGTPLLRVDRLAAAVGMDEILVKDESVNPTGSFKARGLSAAVTRAAAAGAGALTVPTAGNAGVALSAYGQRAGIAVDVFAPETTPPRLIEQMRVFGAEVHLLEGHIGDCGRAARAHAERGGAFDVSTLREPYRIEGKKTLGLEVAEQLGWELPDVCIYPTGGGTGLIGMWIAFRGLLESGWVRGRVPRLYSVQSSGCAPVVAAFESGADATVPWPDPWTVASGLRVPTPLGGRIILQAIRETGGAAIAVTDAELSAGERAIARTEGIDAAPEGGATLAALEALVRSGDIQRHERIVLFNTGAGWLYRR
jgi:threonine synthase